MKLILPDGVEEIVGREALFCRCLDSHCSRSFVVFFLVFDSNIGEMTCPHCGQRTKHTWGRLEIAFVPEPKTKQIITVELLAPADLLDPTAPEPPAMRLVDDEDGP